MPTVRKQISHSAGDQPASDPSPMPGPRRDFETRIEAAVQQCDDLSADQRAAILTRYANQLRTTDD
jgi:hypothetical protein